MTGLRTFCTDRGGLRAHPLEVRSQSRILPCLPTEGRCRRLRWRLYVTDWLHIGGGILAVAMLAVFLWVVVPAFRRFRKAEPLKWTRSQAVALYVRGQVEASGRFEALWLAAREGDRKMAKRMLKAGSDVNEKDEDGSPALVLAAQCGHTAVARLLLDKGADFNLTDQSGWTPLQHAAARDRREIMELLLRAGADPDAKSDDGSTPLRAAYRENRLEAMKLLNAAMGCKRG